MYWATTTFDVSSWTPDLGRALAAWREHITESHPKITDVRCYRYNGCTTIVWQEGFANFHDYQHLMEEQDDVCEHVMADVFRHAVPGHRTGAIWADALS